MALEAVDGGFVEDVLVDSLQAYNTGNAIFLRVGERQAGKKGRVNNVRIKNLVAEIPAGKPDAGYEYESPIEDLPRNISPVVIAGLPDATVDNVSLGNMGVRFSGGCCPFFS